MRGGGGGFTEIFRDIFMVDWEHQHRMKWTSVVQVESQETLIVICSDNGTMKFVLAGT